ncbi:MAG: bifunctional adenosylcobinamide kinase/adenosylcobinamide-phosphate guanylyltransferase [Gammaproteobacteria bacterium]|nr:bifunctional adenosylcobinamide kinase/adenosylcobinamide-phosphate guanylyltransferase [Gammaproteobacteria bacterium]
MIYLIIGGARSGKSHYAESLIKKISKKITYIATASADDEEMKNRIQHHKKTRPKDWSLIEEKLYLSSILKQQLNKEEPLLIECMTLWLSNWVCSENLQLWNTEKHNFLKALKQCKTDIVIVSNEVGSGIVPMGELSRNFVDEAGWLNQELSKLADQVVLVVAGLPLVIKPILNCNK